MFYGMSMRKETIELKTTTVTYDRKLMRVFYIGACFIFVGKTQDIATRDTNHSLRRYTAA